MSRKRKPGHLILIVFLILILILPTAGCWNSTEVEDLAIFTILGFDWVHSGDKDEWLVSGLVIDPGNSGKAEDGMSSTSKETGEKMLQGKGESIEKAVENMTQNTGRVPFWGGVAATILGERTAQEKLEDFMNLKMRREGARPRTFMMVTRGMASDALKKKPVINQALAQELMKMAELRMHNLGISCAITSADFAAILLSPDRDAVATGIESLPEATNIADSSSESQKSGITLGGMAVFVGDRLRGWLSEEETMGYVLITKRIKRGEMIIQIPVASGNATLKLTQSRPLIHASMTGERVNYIINIKAQGVIEETGGQELTDAEILKLEESAGQKIAEIAQKTVKKAQDWQSDFLGLSQNMHRWKPSLWKAVSPNWRVKFQEASISIDAQVTISHTGRLGQKLKIKKQ